MNKTSYYFYEAAHALLGPARAANDAMQLFFRNPINPMAHTSYGRSVSAACELFERTTRRYGKPHFGLPNTMVDGAPASVTERVVWSAPFCNLLHFDRAPLPRNAKNQPKMLIVAPMSGHYATLLRGTVEAFLPSHEVYITDWVDARQVPLALGGFDLEDYVDYVKSMIQFLGEDVHVLAVCQPSVPVAAAIARMEAEDDPFIPRSMILMGGPIDTRESPTEVNKLAQQRGIDWFRRNCISRVPFPHPGVMREVYPGFLQLSGFMAMNLDRHMNAHWDMFKHLVTNDGDSAEKHRDFYDEYLAVMDLTSEFYLQTVDTVFVRHSLPKGEMTHRGAPVDLGDVRRCALMTVEGEKDDISGVGQTKATHALCHNLPKEKHLYHLQKDVGHYGVFNGSRFRRDIAPAILAFTYAQSGYVPKSAPARAAAKASPAADVAKSDLAAPAAAKPARGRKKTS
jgi:poly(3-hydroxybutyrate) depolymerase